MLRFMQTLGSRPIVNKIAATKPPPLCPRAEHGSGCNRSARPIRAITVIAAILCILCILALFTTAHIAQMTGSASQRDPGAENNGRLLAGPTVVDLGDVPQGCRRNRTIMLTNAGAEPVIIDRCRSSCDCIHVTPRDLTVPGRSTIPALITLDLTDDPRFLGTLAVEVTGYTQSKQEAFGFLVRFGARPE